jgi:pseudaminic acid cytidylyltransferase
VSEYPNSHIRAEGATALAVIPARGGSKRIPRKNIKDFRGKPMIAWSIVAAQSSGLFDHVIVSTDDAEIAEAAREQGAEVPFKRPPELSDDHTPTRPVVKQAISEASKLWGKPDFTCCIYATAPFIRREDLKQGLEMLRKQQINFAFTAAGFPFPIQRAFKQTSQGVEMFYPEHLNTRSQDLEEAYHDAGQFYWGRSQAFLDNLPTFGPASHPILLPRYLVHDIDSPEDWERAEIFHKALFP